MPLARRSRAATVAENDEAVRRAVADMAIEVGWDAVTFSGVAKRAGLSVGALYGRAENTTELAIDLWESQVSPSFRAGVARVIEAGRAGDAEAIRAALRCWDDERQMSALTAELLIAALFDADLAEVIGRDATTALSLFMAPRTTAPRVTRHEAAAGTLLGSFVLGRAVAVRGGVHLKPVSAEQASALAGMYATPSATGALPEGPNLRWIRSMHDVDPSTRAVLQGALDVVGRVGYRRATIARIARTSGIPRGSVMTHFSSKAHLVSEAASRGLVPPGEVWSQYAPVIAEHGPLTSRAMFLADFLKHGNRRFWLLNLELVRMARLVPELAPFGATPSVLENTHLGVMLAAAFVPSLDRRPFAGPFAAGSAT